MKEKRPKKKKKKKKKTKTEKNKGVTQATVKGRELNNLHLQF